MHKKHTTHGLVLGKRALGEANVGVWILTEDLGLVCAVARSARRENSRLRYGLEPLLLGRYSFVRGKHEWRLVGVNDVSHECVPGSPARRRRAGHIAKLLLRLMPGEEGNAALYKTVQEGLGTLARVEADEDAAAVECVLVLRILSHLGYLPRVPEVVPFVETDFFSIELAAQAKQTRSHLVRLINDSLSASGL